MRPKYLLLIIALLLYQLSAISQTIKDKNANNYFTQSNLNRTAAEWEPVIGTMIVWPLSIPYKLVVELSKDNHLYTLVANDSTKKEAQKWYNEWGINSNNNTFIFAPQGIDAWWTRDWGPSAVFTNDGEMKLGDGKYIYATPASTIDCNDSLAFFWTKTMKLLRQK
jgi:agmatine deiminase